MKDLSVYCDVINLKKENKRLSNHIKALDANIKKLTSEIPDIVKRLNDAIYDEKYDEAKIIHKEYKTNENTIFMLIDASTNARKIQNENGRRIDEIRLNFKKLKNK